MSAQRTARIIAALLVISVVLAMNTRYGPSWLQPQQILAGRLCKVGSRITFRRTTADPIDSTSRPAGEDTVVPDERERPDLARRAGGCHGTVPEFV